jgi:dTDP-4-dehydrorhamnose reductase
VFPGTEGEAPYETDAATNPPNSYGEMKRAGEVAVLETTKESGFGVVLRLPLLYGHTEYNGESAVNTLLDAVETSKDAAAGIKMDDWARRYPTNTQDVGRVCNDIAVRYIKDKKNIKSLPKILQFSAEEDMTKYDMAQRFATILDVEILGMSANREGNDPNAAVKRPYNTHLSTRALREVGVNVQAVKFDDWWYVFLCCWWYDSVANCWVQAGVLEKAMNPKASNLTMISQMRATHCIPGHPISIDGATVHDTKIIRHRH